MKIFDLVKISFYGIRTHKLRSVLTTIGIIIGVGTVISMMSIIEGINSYVYKLFGEIGADVIYVQKFRWQFITGPGQRGWWKKYKDRPDFTKEDAEDIRKLPFVKETTIYQNSWIEQKVEYKDKKIEDFSLIGVTPEYFEVFESKFEKGRKFEEGDEIFRRNVCIIGKDIEENLFEGENPLNKEVKINGKTFLVIGVLERKGAFLGRSLDNYVYIPFSKLLQIQKKGAKDWMKVFFTPQIAVRIKKGYSMESSIEELRRFLRKKRNLFFTEEDNFSLNTQEMILSMYKSLTQAIFAAMIGIASLALIVGGIGIMNIMLVSVSERTREIGIRMAVGAKRRDILYQFLLEAIFLTAVGGILGLLLGAGIGKLVDILTPLPSYIPPWSIFIALAFSSIIGIFFGIYPATLAARKDPIECLRYE
jgi:putative ABC transport system permease protein